MSRRREPSDRLGAVTPAQELDCRATGRPADLLADLEAIDAEAGKFHAVLVAGALDAERRSRLPSLNAEGRRFLRERAVQRIAQAQQARRGRG